MLRQQMIILLFRGVPEACIYMYALHVFSRKKINKKRMALSISLLALLMVIIRLLPISYGIHTILLAMCMLFFGTLICDIRMAECIDSIVKSLLIELGAEGVNVVFITQGLGLEMTDIMNDPIKKVIFGLPSLLIMLIVIWIIGKIRDRKCKVNV